MYTAVYLEINLVSIVLLLIVYMKYREQHNKQAASVIYIHVVIATLIILVLDAVWSLIEKRPGRAMISLNYWINAAYLITMGFISYFWLQFVLCRLYRRTRRNPVLRILVASPLAILVLMSLATPWTQWFFRITNENVYQRGPLLFIQQIISYGYLLAACGYSLFIAKLETNREKRIEALTLASFAIFPTIGSIANMLVLGLPATWPFTVVSIIMVYLNLQSRQISTDELTGLNNRRQFDHYLLMQLEDPRRDDQLYLLLIDVDAFKKINDTYGHLTGDAALVHTANILKQVCSIWNCFLARYGGDEFAIIFKTQTPTAITHLKDDLLDAFARFNQSNVEPYPLTISIGINAPSSKAKTPDALIAQADHALYQAKAKKKASQ